MCKRLIIAVINPNPKTVTILLLKPDRNCEFIIPIFALVAANVVVVANVAVLTVARAGAHTPTHPPTITHQLNNTPQLIY